jgi:hypothetical protein
MLPLKEIRGFSAATCVIGVFEFAYSNPTHREGAIAVIGLFFLVLAWTLTIHPSNDGHWDPMSRRQSGRKLKVNEW